jgi:homoserine kinase type II
MAVFTHVTRDQVRALVARYDIGEYSDLEPIEQGVENSNFHLFTTKARFILTIFEGRTDISDLGFFFRAMGHLRAENIMCPYGVRDKNGEILQECAGKPAALLSFLNGSGVDPHAITADLCAEVGALCARMHSVPQPHDLTRKNSVSLTAWQQSFDRSRPRVGEVDAGLAVLLDEEFAFYQQTWSALQSLPQGLVHADLFPDNVFVDDLGHVCGVIDFYFMCRDVFAYDLAITLNAWCFDADNHFVSARAEKFMSAYQAIRPLSHDERKYLPIMLRAASVRFLTSRLHDWLFRPSGALVKPKDPREYMAKLMFHRSNSVSVS